MQAGVMSGVIKKQSILHIVKTATSLTVGNKNSWYMLLYFSLGCCLNMSDIFSKRMRLHSSGVRWVNNDEHTDDLRRS
jgi:hypothetical protein